MKQLRFSATFAGCLCGLLCGALEGQITPSPNPSRELGQPLLQLFPAAVNYVEGREFNNPQGVAVDTSSTPSPLYVSDAGNNRVLAWRDASRLAKGAAADLVIGQPDFYTTAAQGPQQPNSPLKSSGMNAPTGLAVDSSGNLYVADSGNNRILRFPKPFSQQGQVLADLEIGQPDFTTGTPNTNGISAKSLAFSSGGDIFDVKLALDSAGNLYTPDPINNRVLRYPVSKLCSGCNDPAADLVFGQASFTTGTYVNPNDDPRNAKVFLRPAGVAVDSGGRLYVSDALKRVAVFAPPFSNGQAAARFLGLPTVPQGTPPPPAAVFGGPEALFFVGDSLGVTDVQSNRVVLFAPFASWTGDMFAQDATSVVGQADFNGTQGNRGQTNPGANTLLGPFGAVFSGGSLYVADSGNNRVLIFPQQGTSFSTASNVLGQVDFIYNGLNLVDNRGFAFTGANGGTDAGIAADFNSNPPHLYIADTYNNRVLGYRDVSKLKSGAAADLVIGQQDFFHRMANAPTEGVTPNDQGLSTPVGLAVDKNGDLYVADAGNGRVLRFPKPFDSGQSFPRANLVIGQSSFTIKLTDATSRTMNAPYGLGFTFNGSLVVSDVAHNRVLLFPGPQANFTNGMPATIVLGQPGFTSIAAGSANNQMNGPRHIGVDGDDRLFVADTVNNRMLVFERVPQTTSGAQPVLTVTAGGGELGGLNQPRALFVNPATNEIWLGDSGNARVLRYPKFQVLVLNPSANYYFDEFSPLAVAQDSFGDLFVAENINRVGIFYPGLVTSDGLPTAINAASFLPEPVQPLAPGTIAAVFAPSGIQFGTATEPAKTLPLPTTLADMQVTVNGSAACLFYSSPTQINFVVPVNAPTTGIAEVDVVRASTGQILGSTPIVMKDVSPGVFIITPGGTQAAVVNEDGSINGTAHPAPTGSVISIYGTGSGLIPGQPADCSAPSGALSTPQKPQVLIGTAGFVPPENLLYSGVAPGLLGVWQINVRIPKTVPPSSSTGGTTPLIIKMIDGVSNGNVSGLINSTIVVKAS